MSPENFHPIIFFRKIYACFCDVILDCIEDERNSRVESGKVWSLTILLSQSRHGILNIWTELLPIFSWSAHMRRELGTQILPREWIFWTMIFYNLKILSQDLSNEGSNFFLSSLEVGHWVAQTWAFLTNYLKLQILAPYKNLKIRHDSEFAKFWHRALIM